MSLKMFSFAVAALAVSGAAWGQSTTVSPGEQRIQSAYDRLRANPGLYVAITGNERLNNSVTPVGTNLYYRAQMVGGRLSTQSNLVDYVSRNGTPTVVSEVVADGKTVWRYDRTLKTYSATGYDPVNPSDPAAQSATYSRDMLFALNQDASGAGRSSYGVRLLRELYGDPNGAQYRTWMPGRAPAESATYHDPFLNADVAEPNCSYIVYSGDPRRSIAFELYTDPSGVEYLQRIYVTEMTRMGSKTRVAWYSIAPMAVNDFTGARFTPYSHGEILGWRPTVSPRSRG